MLRSKTIKHKSCHHWPPKRLDTPRISLATRPASVIRIKIPKGFNILGPLIKISQTAASDDNLCTLSLSVQEGSEGRRKQSGPADSLEPKYANVHYADRILKTSTIDNKISSIIHTKLTKTHRVRAQPRTGDKINMKRSNYRTTMQK